jgi:diadenosine tetraphosphatase ApaH/serine/threonine PP2A family protein phosphatase
MDLDDLIARLREADLPTVPEISAIAEAVIPIFDSEPNVLSLEPPLIVCGDTHGQLFDLIQLFEVGGPIPSSRYLFLGDYVDRGSHSVELITLLLCYKIKYPNDLFLLRGNHETRAVNREYGFSTEVRKKFASLEVWRIFNSVFDMLPIAAIIDSRVFCVHGGLHPELSDVDQLRNIERKQEPDLISIFSGVIWSDPSDAVDDWKRSVRRSGWLFNEHHLTKFLTENSLEKLVRSHEFVNGYHVAFSGKVVTVWSAPNYSGVQKNRAGVLRIMAGTSENYLEYDAMPEENRGKKQTIASI